MHLTLVRRMVHICTIRQFSEYFTYLFKFYQVRTPITPLQLFLPVLLVLKLSWYQPEVRYLKTGSTQKMMKNSFLINLGVSNYEIDKKKMMSHRYDSQYGSYFFQFFEDFSYFSKFYHVQFFQTQVNFFFRFFWYKNF